MDRRALLVAVSALAVASPTASQGTGTAHTELANVLFDLYAAQSVRLSITSALRGRPPGTEEVLAPQVSLMVKSLARHRGAFAVKMAHALQQHATDAEAGALLSRTRAEPPQFDDAARRTLFNADATFRREAQDVIGAMTSDIGLMIATALGQVRQ